MLRIAAAAVIVMASSAVAFGDDIVLRGMGSFHVGGRIAEISGKPVHDIVRMPGGPSTKLDPNGQYQVEQMYAQYFLPKARTGKVPLLMWHGGGLTGVTADVIQHWLVARGLRTAATISESRLPVNGPATV